MAAIFGILHLIVYIIDGELVVPTGNFIGMPTHITTKKEHLQPMGGDAVLCGFRGVDLAYRYGFYKDVAVGGCYL